jgi:beta-fructofuranosidase
LALRLEDKWMWDFWTVTDGPDVHLFFLQAPRSLGDPDLRHWNVSIGHAVSPDLRSWELVPDALAPGPPGAWDDYTTWTGSVHAFGDGWAMLYTGTSRAEDGLIQRIGLATSPDLIGWTKHPANPVIEADPSRYELLDLDLWHDQAWRDPALVEGPDGVFHVFITARVAEGPTRRRGVIAHAGSEDLVSWDIGEPVVGPGDFGHLEIPQAIQIGERWHLLYSVPGDMVGSDRPARTRTYQAVADDVAGPYREPSDPVVIDDPHWYGAKLSDTAAGWRCLAWRDHDHGDVFDGEIGDPWPVQFASDGSISVEMG